MTPSLFGPLPAWQVGWCQQCLRTKIAVVRCRLPGVGLQGLCARCRTALEPLGAHAVEAWEPRQADRPVAHERRRLLGQDFAFARILAAVLERLSPRVAA